MQGSASLRHLWHVGATRGADALQFGAAWGRSRTTLAAENLFVRKQLALCREREVSPRRATDATRLVLVLLARAFPWRDALRIVQPATLIRWHRQASLLWWRWRSRGRGRPRIPADPAPVDPGDGAGQPDLGRAAHRGKVAREAGAPAVASDPAPLLAGEDRGNTTGCRRTPVATVGRNPASVRLAGDVCAVVTARFRVVSGFGVMEIGSRRLVRGNATRHSTAAWTLHQFREALAMSHAYRVVLHDRDSSYALWLDAAITALGVRVLRPPVHAPPANAYGARRVGSLRRECLDVLIPFGKDHLRGCCASGGSLITAGAAPTPASVLACRRHRPDCPRS